MATPRAIEQIGLRDFGVMQFGEYGGEMAPERVPRDIELMRGIAKERLEGCIHRAVGSDALLQSRKILLHRDELSKGKSRESEFGIRAKQVSFPITSLNGWSRFGAPKRKSVLLHLGIEHECGTEPRGVIGVMIDDLISLDELLRLQVGEACFATELIKRNYAAVIVTIYKDFRETGGSVQVRFRCHLLQSEL
jgi:hypothetical protein